MKLSTTSPPHTRKLIALADFRLSSRFTSQTLPERNVQRQYKKSPHPFRSIYTPGIPTTALKYSVSDKQQQLPEIFNFTLTYGHCSFLSQLACHFLVNTAHMAGSYTCCVIPRHISLFPKRHTANLTWCNSFTNAAVFTTLTIQLKIHATYAGLHSINYQATKSSSFSCVSDPLQSTLNLHSSMFMTGKFVFVQRIPRSKVWNQIR